MDTCCRSGNFDEALDLRAFVNKVRLAGGPLVAGRWPAASGYESWTMPSALSRATRVHCNATCLGHLVPRS